MNSGIPMQSRENPVPNLFIVGARKAGTTSLYQYLKCHPEIFMCPVKEPHFFSERLPYHIQLFETQDAYRKLFKSVKSEVIIGEASTSYLDDPTTAQRIARFNPNSKIIIMLRDPMEMIQALHYEFVFRGRSVLPSFEAELKLQRAARRQICYRTILNAIPESILAYQRIFGIEQVLILSFEHFCADTEGEYRRVLNFLGVQQEFTPEFKIYNKSSRPRSLLLQRLFNSPVVRPLAKLLYTQMTMFSFDPFQYNGIPFERPPLTPGERELLLPIIQEYDQYFRQINLGEGHARVRGNS